VAVPALLYGCEIWVIGEKDESMITSAEVKFMRRRAKYTWQGYKTNEDILSAVTINPVVNKIQNYRNQWIHHIRRTDRDRLPHIIVKLQPCGNEAKDGPSKDFSAVNGTGTGHEA
jgi:hypothetical protein